jgi:hypothetical protein
MRSMKTPFELYFLLDKAGFEYEVVEVGEGIRVLRVDIEEVQEDEAE